MNFKLPFMSRIPLVMRKRNGMIYYQIQYEVLREDRSRPGYFHELMKIEERSSMEAIGSFTLDVLRRFLGHPEWTPEEVYQAVGMSWEQYFSHSKCRIEKFVEAANDKDIALNYPKFFIKYMIDGHKYLIGLTWPVKKGKGYYYESAPSTGEPGLLTFDTPLEFDDTIEPEALGRMVLEAFDRCEQLADMAAGNKYPTKAITLLDESVIEVQMPRDKHFADAEDMGVGEIYQAYEYLPSEDADSSANFYLGIGAELNCDVSAENIRTTWEKYYGIAEFFEVKEVNCGIYTLRAELRNKKFHRISYFLPQSETLLLECAMELFQSGKRKKLDERLTELFEDFAVKCKRKKV